MRLFIALNFAEELRTSLYDVTAPLRAVAPAARWTIADKLHLTMKFLGERPPELVSPLGGALDAVAARASAIDLTIAGIGAFPNFRRPRVVWARIATSPALVALHREVEAACGTVGIAQDSRAFHPHVTLARVGPRVPRPQLQSLAREPEGIALHATSIVRTLDLMQSVGGRYVCVHRAPLAG